MAVARHDRMRDIESVICNLRDVISARVITDSEGEIEEIHVLTESSRTPKQVVRDIESAVMAQLGIQIDHRKISVAQVQGGEKQDHSRLKFSDVSLSFEGSRIEATVHLSKDGLVYTGQASGIDSSTSQMKFVAMATLRAVENAGAADGTFSLEDINTTLALGGRTVVVVLISAVSDRGEDYLSGSAVVKKDLWKAVVKATLDAVNRRVFAAHDG